MTSKAVVLHPILPGPGLDLEFADWALQEAVGLAAAVDLEICRSETISITRPRPATLFGKGTLDRLAEFIAEEAVDLVVVNAGLTPVQQRNLERALVCKVIDRTGLILEIFGARARTKEGKVQVELAALSYQRSRLVRSWTHLERQRGGFGFMGGPGERQLEIDRRLITERITRLKKDLAQVRRTRKIQRDARKRVPYPVVALVGYTNAGKSTLFNRLTSASVRAEDLLFATLDPTMRRVALPSGQDIILSDTVGFISDLPTDLVAAFRATLEEVIEADLLLHVRDISHPLSGTQKDEVLKVLESLIPSERWVEEREGAMLEVLNKADALDAETRQVLSGTLARDSSLVLCSALTGEGCDALLARIEGRLQKSHRLLEVHLPYEAGEALAWLYRHGDVRARQDEKDGIHLEVSMDPIARGRFDHLMADESAKAPPRNRFPKGTHRDPKKYQVSKRARAGSRG